MDTKNYLKIILEQLARSSDNLISIYKKLEQIIKEENKAILKHDLNLVSKILEEKEKLTENIDSLIHGIKEKKELIVTVYEKYFEKKWQKTDNLTDILYLLQSFLKESSLIQNDKQLLSTTHKVIEKIIESQLAYKAVKNLVEINKLTLTKLIQNYQKSIRFWKDLAQEENSLYGASGTKQTKETASNFTIKA